MIHPTRYTSYHVARLATCRTCHAAVPLLRAAQQHPAQTHHRNVPRTQPTIVHMPCSANDLRCGLAVNRVLICPMRLLTRRVRRAGLQCKNATCRSSAVQCAGSACKNDAVPVKNAMVVQTVRAAQRVSRFRCQKRHHAHDVYDAPGALWVVASDFSCVQHVFSLGKNHPSSIWSSSSHHERIPFEALGLPPPAQERSVLRELKVEWDRNCRGLIGMRRKVKCGGA